MGSYANRTNVRWNFDVDIAVEYTGYFYWDLCFELEGHDQSEVGVVKSTDTYWFDICAKQTGELVWPETLDTVFSSQSSGFATVGVAVS